MNYSSLLKNWQRVDTRVHRMLQSHTNKVSDVREKLIRYGVTNAAVLVDDLSELDALDALECRIAGYFSDSVDALYEAVPGGKVQPLRPELVPPDVDGWIILSRNPNSSDSLLKFLSQNGLGHQVLVRYAWNQSITYCYSYIDFFAGSMQTTVQLSNYFDVCYRIPSPLDVHFTLRSDSGKVIRAGQRIVPANGLTTISSHDFNLGEFRGYLEIELEVVGRITPFFHYIADYSSDVALASNHQSGLGLHPAGSRFTRGYVPEAEDETLVVCIFQRNYDEPVRAKATLDYFVNGARETAVRELAPVPKRAMRFFDVKELFNDVDFSVARQATVVVSADVPLHRPNYYYKKIGSPGFFDVEHAGPCPFAFCRNNGTGAVPPACRRKVESTDCYAAELGQFVLPESWGVDSSLVLGNDSTAEVKEVDIDFHAADGTKALTMAKTLTPGGRWPLNARELTRSHGIESFDGVLYLHPSSKAKDVPLSWNGTSTYVHRATGRRATTASSGGCADNIPFYFNTSPPRYFTGASSASSTELYGRAVLSQDIDTGIAVMFKSADKRLFRTVEYEIVVCNKHGRKRSHYRTISAHGADYFLISELVSRPELEEDRYTLWLLQPEVSLYAQHFLMRSDGAISVEHFYPGRFGR